MPPTKRDWPLGRSGGLFSVDHACSNVRSHVKSMIVSIRAPITLTCANPGGGVGWGAAVKSVWPGRL